MPQGTSGIQLMEAAVTVDKKFHFTVLFNNAGFGYESIGGRCYLLLDFILSALHGLSSCQQCWNQLLLPQLQGNSPVGVQKVTL